jgi:hypothetical protein
MWIYNQSNGTFSKDGQVVGHGYSGFGSGKNNPALQNLIDVGPIPEGFYEIGPPQDTTSHGPHVMSLSPAEGTNTFGRCGFLIHGDSVENPGAASHGCIILAHGLRMQVSSSSDTQLQVV